MLLNGSIKWKTRCMIDNTFEEKLEATSLSLKDLRYLCNLLPGIGIDTLIPNLCFDNQTAGRQMLSP